MRRKRATFPVIETLPSFARPVSQACTAAQFAEPAVHFWCEEMKIDHRLHRELWERAFVCQALARQGCLAPGRRGLALQPPDLQLASLFRAYGCSLLVTHDDADRLRQWQAQFAKAETATMTFDMRHPQALCATAGEVDFLWSRGMTQQGSREAGQRFVDAALSWLLPGGVAVFTLDYECNADPTGLSPHWSRHHLLALLDHLAQGGCSVAVNLHLGEQPDDRDIDVPPYRSAPHLKLMMGDRQFTSFGIIVKKAG